MFLNLLLKLSSNLNQLQIDQRLNTIVFNNIDINNMIVTLNLLLRWRELAKFFNIRRINKLSCIMKFPIPFYEIFNSLP